MDAVVGWRDLASSMIGDNPKVLFLHLCCRFNKSLPPYSLSILKTENTSKAVKTTAWLVVAGLYHTYFFICLGRLVKKTYCLGTLPFNVVHKSKRYLFPNIAHRTRHISQDLALFHCDNVNDNAKCPNHKEGQPYW